MSLANWHDIEKSIAARESPMVNGPRSDPFIHHSPALSLIDLVTGDGPYERAHKPKRSLKISLTDLPFKTPQNRQLDKRTIMG